MHPLFRRLRTIMRTQYRIFMRKTFWLSPVKSTILLVGWSAVVRAAIVAEKDRAALNEEQAKRRLS
ncbi:hypothetical protein GGTG_08740 [Gaeumannomyces tritici R3-111a-1]|uniref:Uncharacterized protein n=1 Tax=Gaeumannomyces tritici (strain R3-111a-1) TaxID=644352 RepID=J3P5F1_GAET3|nr:hypothetical protein GGTG_08740 [Gaeumannomyces tritici R3-111a-1]EJT74902.1 hypothetical protein GGTG_08740 [Gaeumannomyces tritici R3-111a-1]